MKKMEKVTYIEYWNEIFIQTKGIGFTFLLDKKMKHNLISPAFLAFFNLGERQMYALPIDNIREVNTKPAYDNLQPFLPEYADSINFNNVFHYVGKKVGRCKDNKLRICKVFMLEFEYKGYTFSFLFLLDKSLKIPAILGLESFNHIIRTVMKPK
ncbi:hypothetical protein [Bacteroides caecigallinarum]|jgi:hypothetical protein|uniref:hypothetical protein n=1 Tax=Bacteroides caecigallinarum TaxID=1411144 RepID=UPI001EF55F64|nr:hypothetical protein [Bacteroides caecigallinarum]